MRSMENILKKTLNPEDYTVENDRSKMKYIPKGDLGYLSVMPEPETLIKVDSLVRYLEEQKQ